VRSLVGEHGMSEPRAGQASGIARSTLRYRPAARDVSGVMTFIQAHMALNPRHGFGLLHDSARHQNKPWGKTVLWHVCCELWLNLPRRGKSGYLRASNTPCTQQASPTRARAATS